MSKWDYERALKRGFCSYYAGDLFYELKNRILAKYGKPAGYQLQFWEVDEWDDEGFHEWKEHKHILQIIRLNGFEFHQPTGHFHFYSDDDYSSYQKQTVEYPEFEKLCGNQIIKGKKEVKLEGDELKKVTKEFYLQLRFLIKKFHPLLMRPFHRKNFETVVIRDNYMEKIYEEQKVLKQQHPSLDLGF